MFDAVVLSSTGSASPARALIITDHQNADGRTRLQRSTLADFAWSESYWPQNLPESLLLRLLDDLSQSSFLDGDIWTDDSEPAPAWSPAGAMRPDHVGRWQAGEELISRAAGLASPIELLDGVAPDAPIFAFNKDGARTSAVAFGRDAFVLPVEAGAEFVDVDIQPDSAELTLEERLTQVALQAVVPAKVRRFLVWQLHMGPNSMVVTGSSDGSGRWRRVRLGGTRAGGFLVGRAAMGVYAKTSPIRRDPLAERRRVGWELKHASVARECPDVRLVYGRLPHMAVAVHGTMSSAVPLAGAMRASIAPGTPVVRFEHDTWLPIGDNASALAAELRRLGARQVLMVAHSRGGLVAEMAAAELMRTGTAVNLVSLGTPYRGTPIIGAVKGGLLGARTLMGALRATPGTGPVIDHGTRLIGFLLRGDLPRGLAAMEPGSDFLQVRGVGRAPSCHRFGGRADPTGNDDSYGVHFLDGLAHPVFGETDHDLVVSARSALDSERDPAAEDGMLANDHFSYLLQHEVITAIKAHADVLPATMPIVTTEEPSWLRGLRTGAIHA